MLHRASTFGKDTTAAAYFDGSNAQTGHLLKTCISSSDAHRPEDLGLTPTWAQMEGSQFWRVAGCSRTSPPRVPIGTNIAAASDRRCPCSGCFPSRHLATAVTSLQCPHWRQRVRGKTSVLECLRFALGTDVPRENQPKVNEHLAAVLGPAGRVRLLVIRDDGARLIIELVLVHGRFRGHV